MSRPRDLVGGVGATTTTLTSSGYHTGSADPSTLHGHVLQQKILEVVYRSNSEIFFESFDFVLSLSLSVSATTASSASTTNSPATISGARTTVGRTARATDASVEGKRNISRLCIYIYTYTYTRCSPFSTLIFYVSLFPSLFVLALGAAETTGGAKEGEGEARSIEEEG